jgi:hypothetical protein
MPAAARTAATSSASVARRREVVGGGHLGQDRCQQAIVVAAEVSRSIIGKHEGEGVRVGHLLDVRGDRPTEGTGGPEEMVAGHDEAGRGLDDDRLLLAEPAQALGDRSHIAPAGVAGMELDAVDRNVEADQLRRDTRGKIGCNRRRPTPPVHSGRGVAVRTHGAWRAGARPRVPAGLGGCGHVESSVPGSCGKPDLIVF